MSRPNAALTWTLVLVTAAILLAVCGFRTRDPDSRAYIRITARLADEPASRWIAPQWWGAWGPGMQGLFREHPIGTFVPPALLARAGYPVAQAPFVVSLAAQIGCLLLIAALAARLAPAADAHALAWALQLLPIAFVFRVRANQEYPLLFGVMLAVYGIERAREHGGWVAVAAIGFLYALVVKGVFALLAPVLAAMWLLTRRKAGTRIGAMPWIGVALLCALAPIAAWGYERAYVAVTGQSFLDYYLGARISLDADMAGAGLPFPIDKLANAGWYCGRLLWYAAPWSVVLAGWIWTMRLREFRDRAALASFALAGTLVTIAAIAMRDTKADRYIFPAYFLAGTGGVIAACARWPRVAAIVDRLDRWWPWGPAALWLALAASRIVMG